MESQEIIKLIQQKLEEVRRDEIVPYMGNGYYDSCLGKESILEDILHEIGVEEIEEIEEENININYFWIKENVGWSCFAELTGRNVYAINEFGDYEDNSNFTITRSQAIELGYIKA